jgi:hypothetical protein
MSEENVIVIVPEKIFEEYVRFVQDALKFSKDFDGKIHQTPKEDLVYGIFPLGTKGVISSEFPELESLGNN